MPWFWQITGLSTRSILLCADYTNHLECSSLLVNHNWGPPGFFVSVASKGFILSVSPSFATLAGRHISVAAKDFPPWHRRQSSVPAGAGMFHPAKCGTFRSGNCWYTPGSYRKSGKQRGCGIPNLEEDTEDGRGRWMRWRERVRELNAETLSAQRRGYLDEMARMRSIIHDQ